MTYADHQMKNKKQSLDVDLGREKKLGLFLNEKILCTITLYNYIDLCLMETRNIDLHLKSLRNTETSRIRKNKAIFGELIEKCPDTVRKRERFGDWKIDIVNGLRVVKDHAFLILTERKTCYEVIIKIDEKSATPVNRALSSLREAAGKDFERLFKVISSDNGVEFLGLSELLRGITNHPYSSWKRGINENHNGMIRLFIPKGTWLEEVTLSLIRRVQDWKNNLSRKILGYATERECILEEMRKLGLFAQESATT